jgi:predicted nucleotidyltransferase
MLQIEDRHRRIIREILNKYPYKFYAFGSRAKNCAKKFSDLDICFMDNIPYNIRAHIEEDFENS